MSMVLIMFCSVLFCSLLCLAPQYGGSPLHQACSLDLPEATKALLEHGASVVQSFNKKTPLEVALEKKGSRCVKVGECFSLRYSVACPKNGFELARVSWQ